MKVIITKEYNPISNSHYFAISTKENGLIKCQAFYPDTPDTQYTEEFALKQAHELTERLEKSGSQEIQSEIIYETPE